VRQTDGNSQSSKPAYLGRWAWKDEHRTRPNIGICTSIHPRIKISASNFFIGVGAIFHKGR
jgi:hypothetical protein